MDFLKSYRTYMWLLIVVVIGSIGWLVQRRLNANAMEKLLAEKEPVGIRVAVVDDRDKNATVALFQLVAFPEHKFVALYFLNTEAHFGDDKEPILRLSPSSADKIENYSKVNSRYHLHITYSNAVRLFDVLGGMGLFLEQPVFFRKARHQYPQGHEVFPGSKLMEYALAKLRTKEKDEVLESIDRVFRQESLALTMFWRLKKLRPKLEHEALQKFVYSLLSTNMTMDELSSLLNFLEDDTHASTLEVPLRAVTPKNLGARKQILVVNEQAAVTSFRALRDSIRTGQYRQTGLTVEVRNGTERKGLAGRVKRFLQDSGPLVLSVGNYAYKPLLKTTIIDRGGSTYHARALAIQTGTKPGQVFFRRRTMQVKVSFLIGKDFRARNIKL